MALTGKLDRMDFTASRPLEGLTLIISVRTRQDGVIVTDYPAPVILH